MGDVKSASPAAEHGIVYHYPYPCRNLLPMHALGVAVSCRDLAFACRQNKSLRSIDQEAAAESRTHGRIASWLSFSTAHRRELCSQPL